ncbi:MAG: hypothetical protein Kow0037_15410 [Calditrichia bacterium]
MPDAPETVKDFPELKNEFIRVSGEAVLRQAGEEVCFSGFAGLFKRKIEKPVPVATGRLAIGKEHFSFLAKGQTYRFKLSEVSCITTNSNYLEFKIHSQHFYQIEFKTESPLKYEIIFRKLLDRYYAGKSANKILEYQPVIRTKPLFCKTTRPTPLKNNGLARQAFLLEWTARILRLVLRIGLSPFIRVTINGRENLPEYPAVFLPNHQSALDPFILIAYLRRFIGFLTKSTSFLTGIERFVLKIGRAIPTTRYQTDPLAVRHWLQMLENGQSVGIFPEAERSWDGAVQPFKMAVIRVLAEKGIPIVPIRIEGAFDFLPRWSHRPRRSRVKINILPPLCLNPGIGDCQVLAAYLKKMIEETSLD